MNNVDKQYLDLLRLILETGVEKKDRTGTGTKSIFSHDMRFDMREGFPLLTSKKMFMKGVIHELIWFLNGETNIKYLLDNGVHIWDGDCYKHYIKSVEVSSNPHDRNIISQNGNAFIIGDPFTKEEFINKIKTDSEFSKKWGDLGPIYGKQWRNWEKYKKRETHGPGLVSPVISYDITNIDQINNLIDDLRSNPDSRRLMVTAWNPSDLEEMVLPPCHYGFQCWTREMTSEERYIIATKKGILISDITENKLDSLKIPKRYLSLKWTQRSCDVPLGIPYNISSYGILLCLIAREVNMEPLELIFSGGDCHIYLNQLDGVKCQLSQETFDLPKIELYNKSIFDFKFEDIKIIGYTSSPTIKYELSN